MIYNLHTAHVYSIIENGGRPDSRMSVFRVFDAVVVLR